MPPFPPSLRPCNDHIAMLSTVLFDFPYIVIMLWGNLKTLCDNICGSSWWNVNNNDTGMCPTLLNVKTVNKSSSCWLHQIPITLIMAKDVWELWHFFAKVLLSYSDWKFDNIVCAWLKFIFLFWRFHKTCVVDSLLAFGIRERLDFEPTVPLWN